MNNKSFLLLRLTSLLLFSLMFVPHTNASADGLVPPPPSFYTCHLTDDGTVCNGIVTNEYYGLVDSSCPQGFNILENGYINENATRYYNSNGYLVRRVLYLIYPVGDPRNILFNSQTGKSVPHSTDIMETDDFSTPGDFNSIAARLAGSLYTITLPGGSPLVHNVGLLTFAPESDILDVRGPKMLILGDAEELCAALN